MFYYFDNLIYLGRASYCISGRCEDFVCDPYDEAVFTQMPGLCPVDKESNEITWRTGTFTTTS